MPTLEERVTRLEVDMAEQKRLRAGQDSDLSDISQKVRAQDQLLKAIAKTQSEHTATLADHSATLADHTATLADHTRRFERLEVSVDSLKDGVGKIIGMLDILIEQDGRR